jgi:CHAT domain-containing protein
MKESSSISLLVQSKPNVLQNRGILIIGDPVQVTPEYGRLVNARDEIGAAAKNFPGSAKVISGPAATPSSYEASTPRKFDIIHFATHGFASDTRPLDSAIILSSQADGIFKLYGRDIVKIPIKADVVTISACYGAGERTYSGEGLVGLAWAFMRAGAHRVIAGLWKVDDQSTPELMNNFYAELKNGTRVAAALRDAKLKMVHSTSVYRLPYYWASLQLYSGS